MRNTVRAAVMVLAISVAGQGLAGPFEDAEATYDRQDYATAMRRFQSLAEQGDARAQVNLGFMHDFGLGVSKDDVLAVKWYRLAADQGQADAQFNLGAMYNNGQGVPKDDVLAYMWFNLAAAGGYTRAQKNRDIVARRITPTQISAAQKLSREWKPIAK